MKSYLKIVSQTACVGLLLLLSGCRSAFQPPPYSYEVWKKTGSTQLEVKKALLECGYPNPLGSQMLDLPKEKIALMDLCMENAGFVYETSRGIRRYCEYSWAKSLPACQPGAVIPKPSKERRLNGDYCMEKLNYDYCVKHAPYPNFCINNDYKNPPKECLP